MKKPAFIGTTTMGKRVYDNMTRSRKDHVQHALDTYPRFIAEDHYNAARMYRDLIFEQGYKREYAYKAHGDAARFLENNQTKTERDAERTLVMKRLNKLLGE